MTVNKLSSILKAHLQRIKISFPKYLSCVVRIVKMIVAKRMQEMPRGVCQNSRNYPSIGRYH